MTIKINETKFSNWMKWSDRNKQSNIHLPGIYVIALTDENIDGHHFDWIENIIYVGMSNSKGGIKQRLTRFDRTISTGKRGHGGAQRVSYKYSKDELVNDLYVSVRWFDCNISSNYPKDLIVMGEVAKTEYVCFAEYVSRYNRLPEFNDMKRSPKK